MLRETRPRLRINHRGDQHGYLLNLLLQSQNSNPKRHLQKRERSYPKGKRERLTPVRMGTTLQRMEMPKQTRHRKLKVLEMPSELCEFLITVYFWRLCRREESPSVLSKIQVTSRSLQFFFSKFFGFFFLSH
uniref:Uncharacterized protein n=1 Tax=Vombatus ursinus TaxID=29139 RepID=A0A4X2K8D8_VOMUR